MIRCRSHSQTRRPGEHGDDLGFGMRVWSNVIAFWDFQPESEHSFLAGIAVEHRRLRTRRNGRRGRPPFEFLRRDNLMLVCGLGQCGFASCEAFRLWMRKVSPLRQATTKLRISCFWIAI